MRALVLFAAKWPSVLRHELAALGKPASDVASSLARIDVQLGHDYEAEPDPLRSPPSRGLRVWCSEE